MIAERRAIHGSRSSREFHTSASRPPPVRRTRAISGSATAWSNQWKACPQVTTSADTSDSGIDSALPASAVTPGRAASSSARISASGSTAVTRCPRATSPRVSFPVPAPRSTTSHGASPASQRTASSGYPGRPRSYASATFANEDGGPRRSSRCTTIGPQRTPHSSRRVVLRRCRQLSEPRHGRGEQPEESEQRTGHPDPERRPKADGGPQQAAGQ